MTADNLLVHNVYFRLNDRSAEARQRLVDACRRLLPHHDGVVYFACGTLAQDLSRDVNDRDWDVGVHLVFRDKAAHDAYQESAAHKQFVAENAPTWQRARVFDTLASQTPTV